MKIVIDIQEDGEMLVAVGGDIHRCIEAHFAVDHTGPTMTLTHSLSPRAQAKAASDPEAQGGGYGYMDGGR